jgi:hypothetical protein
MPRNNNVCAECGGTLKKKTITHTQPWGEELYRIENVPALGGVLARLAAKAAHNFCTWLNQQLSRPNLTFADLIAR